MEVLEACGPDDLLILDNADQANMTALRRELSALKLKVLVTTRHSGEKNDFRVRRLAREELYQIFDRHGAQVSDAQRDALIEAVAGHTMTVDMIARTLADEWCNASPEEIRSAMLGSEMEEDDYPEIDTDHDGDPEQRKIYGHLRALFQLQNLKKEEEQALRCAALLPPEGMHNQLFRQALPEECRDSIRDLHRRGWVQSENKLLTIHPVVRLVCRRELKPTVENCREFLLCFRGQYDSTTYDREKFAQIAALYETASQVLGETDGFWACEAGYLWDVLVEPRRALTCNLRAVDILEQNDPGSLGLASAYNNLGLTYDHLGDHEKAQEYQLKALAIQEQSLPLDHPNNVMCRSNIALTYAQMGDFIRASEYMDRALDSAQRSMKGHPDLEMYRWAAKELARCARCQERGEPFDSPFQ